VNANIKDINMILARVGGEERAARLCGVAGDALRKWREKGYIPPKNWPAIVDGSGGQVGYETLNALYQQAKPSCARKSRSSLMAADLSAFGHYGRIVRALLVTHGAAGVIRQCLQSSRRGGGPDTDMDMGMDTNAEDASEGRPMTDKPVSLFVEIGAVDEAALRNAIAEPARILLVADNAHQSRKRNQPANVKEPENSSLR